MRPLVALVAFLALATPASAAELPRPPHVALYQAACPAYAAPVSCADRDTGELWVQRGQGPFVYWHEVGHVFDGQVLTGRQRAEFARLTADPRPWWDGLDTFAHADGHYNETYAPPGERFADAYGTCVMQATGRPRWGVTWDGGRALVGPTGYGYGVSWRRHQRVCQLIWNAAGLHYTRARAPREPSGDY